MPPKSSQRMEVRLFYIEGRFRLLRQVLGGGEQGLAEGRGEVMRKAGDAAAEAKRVTAGVDDPLQKVRPSMPGQEIKNLSYDKTLTSRRREELKIKDNGNVADVLKRGYGLRSDITRSSRPWPGPRASRPRSSACPGGTTSSSTGTFGGLYNQFDAELPCQDHGEDKLFDPATPFCPVGMVHWSCAGSVLPRAGRGSAAVPDDPDLPAEHGPDPARDRARARRRGHSPARSSDLPRQEALIRRVEHIGDDETEVRKEFRDGDGRAPAGRGPRSS